MQASGIGFQRKHSNIGDAGRYVPYISSAFLDQKDTSLFDLKGMKYFRLQSQRGYQFDRPSLFPLKMRLAFEDPHFKIANDHLLTKLLGNYQKLIDVNR